MKYSVSLYSFYNALKRNLITPFACIEQAKDLGFDAVEAVDFVNFDCVPEERLERGSGNPQRGRTVGPGNIGFGDRR